MTFPALFLGAAAGLTASHLPGLSQTPAVAVCMAAATVSVLRLPLSAAILAILLTSKSGAGAEPLVIVAVVVATVVTFVLAQPRDARPGTGEQPAAGPAATDRPGHALDARP